MLSEQRRQFPARFRLKRRADFQKVYRDGVRATGRHVVIFLMRAGAEDGRFGVTASRRVGGAILRSRCKRRLRELYRLHRSELDREPVDMVANARSSCARAPWPELELDFMSCARRALDELRRTPRPD